MRRLWIWLIVLLTISGKAAAQDSSTTVRRSLGNRIEMTVYMLYTAPAIVPQFVFHESMHKAALTMLGVPSKIVITHLLPWNFDPPRLRVYTQADSTIASKKIGNSRWKLGFVALLPEVGDLLIRDRLAEQIFRGRAPRGGCLMVDCVYFLPTYTSITGPVFLPINPLLDYDLTMAANLMGVRPWKLKLALQALYLYSGWRVYQSAYHH